MLDRNLRTPRAAQVLDGKALTLIFHGPDVRPVGSRSVNVEHAALELRDGRLDLSAMLKELARRDINEIQVEAGPALCGSFFAQGLVDELLLYVAPVLLGDAAKPLLNLPALAEMSERWNLKTMDQRSVGADWRLLMRAGEN